MSKAVPRPPASPRRAGVRLRGLIWLWSFQVLGQLPLRLHPVERILPGVLGSTHFHEQEIVTLWSKLGSLDTLRLFNLIFESF